MTNLEFFYGLPWTDREVGTLIHPEDLRRYDRFPLKVELRTDTHFLSLNIQLFGQNLLDEHARFTRGASPEEKNLQVMALKQKGETLVKEAFDGLKACQEAFRLP